MPDPFLSTWPPVFVHWAGGHLLPEGGDFMDAAWAILYLTLGAIAGIVFCLAMDMICKGKGKE